MIHYTQGDIFEAQTDAIINTVNTVGVMGKGIALQFKQRFPANYEAYKKACDTGALTVGQLLITEPNSLFFKYIINFPTKVNWIHPSKYEYIESGLKALVQQIKALGIQSIAIPPLGAGNGKLEWAKVKTMIEQALAGLEGVDIYIYEPQSQFEERDNQKSIKSDVSLTPVRALLLQSFHDYAAKDNSLNLLVSQKLAYFLQRFGEPMRLEFAKGWYGPYAPNLNKVLQALNGVFISYAAQYDKPATPIRLVPEKYPEVTAALTQLTPAQQTRAATLRNFLSGFETPFSLELLATVDWIICQKPDLTPTAIHAEINTWTKRKAELIKPYHVQVAYEHLNQYKPLLCPTP